MTFSGAVSKDQKPSANEALIQPSTWLDTLDRYTDEAIRQAIETDYHMTGVVQYLEYYECN